MRSLLCAIIVGTLLLSACGRAPQAAQLQSTTATAAATIAPTEAPTSVPTAVPTTPPTNVPTSIPTTAPTEAPTSAPSPEPTARLMLDPTPPPPTLAPTAPPPQPTDPPAAEARSQPQPEAPAPTTEPPPPAPAEQPAAAPSAPVRLVIDDIGLNRRLVSVGLDRHNVPIVPDHDIGWYNLSAMPGQGENIVLWGHVLRFRNAPNIPAPFARLKELKPGAIIVLKDEAGTSRTYSITRQVWATPDQVEYILPVGQERLTMVSCIGDKVITGEGLEMTHRLITIAEPVR